MAKFRCRLLDRNDTELEVEAHEATFAPDNYVHHNVGDDGDEGGIAFVEVLDPSGPCPNVSGWQLWRVEKVAPGAYVTTPITLEDARAEMAKWQKDAS